MPIATPTRPSGSWYSRSAVASQVRPPSTKLDRLPEMKTLIWVALLPMAAGTAVMMMAFTAGVIFGRLRRMFAPALRAAHQHRPACATPATSTAQEAA